MILLNGARILCTEPVLGRRPSEFHGSTDKILHSDARYAMVCNVKKLELLPVFNCPVSPVDQKELLAVVGSILIILAGRRGRVVVVPPALKWILAFSISAEMFQLEEFVPRLEGALPCTCRLCNALVIARVHLHLKRRFCGSRASHGGIALVIWDVTEVKAVVRKLDVDSVARLEETRCAIVLCVGVLAIPILGICRIEKGVILILFG
mmetsp:Transcript_26787/g.76854  ORF Transcript_26787/g.76854 Transcript_26787/m.76854 type:complete len:208 (+) Transcript_26787:474-1097(+)